MGESRHRRDFRTPSALRDALEDRLAREARHRDWDVGRLRRQVAFERLLVRLAADSPGPPGWVLKGGQALEMRLEGQCRATRDLDLATSQAAGYEESVRDRLVDALSEDIQSDGFIFQVATPRPLAADQAGRPGWRLPVDVRLAGRTFVSARVEVVARAEEVEGAVEQLAIPSRLAFAGFPPLVRVWAVDLAQHAAEKLHALTRDYGERPNTRVKDLVDLVLLAEHGWIDPDRLSDRVRKVFSLRATHKMPADLPSAPASWPAEYAALTADLDVRARSLDDAIALINPIWKACAHDNQSS